MEVLIVDDEPQVSAFIARCLVNHHYESESVGSYDEALDALRKPSGLRWTLVLLDVSLSGRSGYDLLLKLREDGNEIPVIFLTGHGGVDNRVKGLALGADDYIVKPFAAKELIARVDAVIRRNKRIPTYALGTLEVDLAYQAVRLSGSRIEFTPKEFSVLMELLWADGELVSKSQLLSNIWGIEFDPGTKIVEVQIARVRKKLHVDGSPVIETVPGKGYRLIAPKGDVRPRVKGSQTLRLTQRLLGEELHQEARASRDE